MITSVKRRVLEKAFRRFYAWRLQEFVGKQVISLDYPVDPRPRYEPGHQPHGELAEWFNRHRAACAQSLGVISRYVGDLERIPTSAVDSTSPYWNNAFFSALDAMALHAFVASRRPRQIIEVGSGNSTKFASHAIRRAGLSTALVSIDPRPRAEIDSLCTRVVRSALEDIDQAMFRTLAAGDFLFIDSSHRAFTNSDVTTFFLDILPRLPAAVVVHVHDIFLPWDYPREWSGRYYSEQYLMACWLLAGPQRCRLLLSNAFVSYDAELRQRLVEMLAGSALAAMFAPDATYGGITGLAGVSLWFETA